MSDERTKTSSKTILHEDRVCHDIVELHKNWSNEEQLETYAVNEISTNHKDVPNTKEKETHYNQPHPALEYPMLYHILKRFPQHMELYKSLHERRWKMSYRLQRYIPDIQNLQQNGKIGYTYAEAILMIPFLLLISASITYSFVSPSTHMSGKVSRYAIILALVFAQRNSYLTLLIGMAVDRGHTYHKIAGYVAFVTGVFHTFAYFLDNHHHLGPFEGSVNRSGVGILVLLTTMVITASPMIRRNLFELFYYVHIICLICIAGCTFYHTGMLVPTIVLCIWGVDIFIRSIIMARCLYPLNASIRTISDSVTELSFPKSSNFCYNPGQYVYLAVPEISSTQWHPFSIATAPSVDGDVKFYIRRTGAWTSALFDLAKSKRQVYVLMEGPYGNLSVDLLKDRKYKNVMLISGGIGVTPMQSIYSQLVFEQNQGIRKLDSFKFIWIQRDPVVVTDSDLVRDVSNNTTCKEPISNTTCHTTCHDSSDNSDDDIEQQQHHRYIVGDIGSSAAYLTTLPQKMVSDDKLTQYFDTICTVNDEENSRSSDANSVTKQEDIEINPSTSSMDGNNSNIDDNDIFRNRQGDNIESIENVFDLQVYITGQECDLDGAPDHITKNIQFGRPDIYKLFRTMRDDVIARGNHRGNQSQIEKEEETEGNDNRIINNRVAVCVCAPGPVADACRRASIMYSNEHIRFDIHFESMCV